MALKSGLIGDASHTITQFIADSWTSGDRLLCGDCHELRGATSDHRSSVGRCDGCGQKVRHLWEWRIDDLPPMARENVELSEWAMKHKRES